MPSLTESHRQAQARLGARVVALMHAAWRLLDPADLDGTFDDWLVIVEPIIQRARVESGGLAAAYLIAQRASVLGFDRSFAPILADRGKAAAIRTSMLVTGPVSIRSALGRSVALAEAADVAEGRAAAAAMRHALNGGRETILKTLKADKRAVGYQRVTSGKPCSFCSMLADRGAVYGEDSASFKAHDGCSCSAEPVYR